jgi:putative RNA 2'-phosphotransferase
MLRSCSVHGFFRGEKCPVCGDIGKFLLNDDEVEHLSKVLAGVLRHFPDRYKLEVDPHGWVDLKAFLTAVQKRHRQYRFLRTYHIIGLIETDPKGRYQYDGTRIRATYGHSYDVDLDLPTDNIPPKLYYPSTPEEADILLETGIKPTDRKMVHLSATIEDAQKAGRVRVDQPIILEVDTEKTISMGNKIMRAGKTVYIVNEIPKECIKKLE